MAHRRVGSLSVAVAILVAACGGDGGGGTEPAPQTGTVVAQVSAGGAGVQGAQVALGSGTSQTTGSDGRVQFSGVQAGSHTVTLQQLPQGFSLGTETAGKTASVQAGGTANVTWSVQAAPVQNAVVRAEGTSFSPGTVRIVAGGSVRFEFVSGTPHTVTPENSSGTWTERPLESAADNFTVTFSTPGTFRFRCRPHSSGFGSGQGMNGVVIVE